MFAWLGTQVSQKPKRFIAFWIILALIGAIGAFSGIGFGSLISRMESSQSMIPGSESDRVLLAAGNQGQGENVLIAVEHANANNVETELSQFRNAINDIPHVKGIHDPVTVAEEFDRQTAEETNKAIEKAIADAQPMIDQAVAGALASQTQQLEQLKAFAGQAAYDQAEQKIVDQTTAEVKKQITARAQEEAKKKLQDIDNPADKFRSGDDFLIVVQLDPGRYPKSIDEISGAITDFNKALVDSHSDARATAMSTTLAQNAILDQTHDDLVTGEIVGLPIALILLVIIFGGLLAAGLPLGSALVSITIGLGGIWALTFVTNVDSFILNIVTLIGLALSIDYGLLVVSRYREEISARNITAQTPNLSAHIAEAVSATIATAGRTVTFSALTIACAISGLFAMHAPMLRMIATGGIVVTVLAVASAITLVPALLVIAGKKLIVPSVISQLPGIRTLTKHLGDTALDHGAFSRLTRWVHRRPWPVMVSALAILIVMALPISSVALRSNFLEYLPSDSTEKTALNIVDEKFPDFSIPSGTVLAYTDIDKVDGLVKDLGNIPHVTKVSEPVKVDDGVLVSFDVESHDPVGKNVTAAINEARQLSLPYQHDVGGAAALQIDFNNANAVDAPLALSIIAVSVIVLLFFMTGSLIAPFTALIINSFSLLAGLGTTAFLFRHGALGLPQTPGLETFVVASAIAFGFGLAMDYEVFLLARIKEFWDAGEDNDVAVEHGVQRSGRIITSAAAIIIAVFVGFVFGDLIAVKQIGVVLAIIVIVDATIVRLLLVPATMTVLGRWNWWAPGILRRVHQRFHLVH